MMIFLSFLLLGLCASVVSVLLWSSWSVCEVVLVPYVDAVVDCDACTVICGACVYVERV